MTREEAIEIVKKHGISADGTKFESALRELIPELAESKDEKTRKEIIEYLWDISNQTPVVKESLDCRRWITWLEKQKENIEKEYVFRPLAGTDITIAAEQAIRRVNEGDHLVLAFNGAYIPVRKGCTANKIVDIYDAFIEKQKDASKAMEAVDKIDKYIDENVANAHDMKNSHPDKKYCQGIDATLSDISGILLDVYSEKENKFAPRVLPCSAAWFEDGDEKQQEQKHILKFQVGDKVHLEGDDVNILTITGIEKDRYLTDNSYGPILFGTEDIWQIVEQKLAEDKELLKNILFQKKGITYDDYKCKNNPYVGLYFDELIKCLEEYDKARSNR